MDVDRFNLMKLNEGEVKEQYQVTIKNRVSDMENLEDNGDINRVWEAMRENIKILPKSVSVIVKQSVIKTWCDEECSNLVDRRKQCKVQWLQDPSIGNEDNLGNVRREVTASVV
jgi:predicted transcriptional regulator